MGNASDICRMAYDTVMEKYGPVYYRRDNNPTSYGYQYNVGQWNSGHWSFDCLGFVHCLVNGFRGDKELLGGGAIMDNFVLASDENTTLNSYCSTRGSFPKADIKPASLLKQSDHVGLYIGEHYVPEINQTINTAEVCMSMGGGGKFSYVDTSNGNRYSCKGGQYLSTWTNWGEFDRVTYDGGMTTDKKEEAQTTPATTPTAELQKGDLGIDLSYHQGEANWYKLKNAGVKFAIIREGWGEDCDGKGVDPGFKKYVKGAKEAGVQIMVYHFMYGTCAADAVENAKCAIKNVREAGLGKDTVIWCDLEYDIVDDAAKEHRGYTKLTNSMQRTIAETFCDYIMLKGYPTGLYTNKDYVTRVLGEDILKKYDIWLADLDGADDYPCLIRQYDWYSKYDGISVNVDKDVFRGVYTVGTAKPQTGTKPTPKPADQPKKDDKATRRKHVADAMRVVSRGTKGLTAEILQKILRDTGDYTGDIDGVAGAYTDKAIRAYQKRNGLDVDGFFGPKSWLSLLTTYPTYCVKHMPHVAYGSRGEIVKVVQTVLRQYGWYSMAVDGQAGPGTVAGIKLMQTSIGVPADGSCGPQTWTAWLV